jgi:phthalate 4,5-cis-dihydrodiol dehydrogenase
MSGDAPQRVLRLGVAGLGRAFTLMLPTFVADPRIRLVAAADPRAEACARFAADFGGTVHESVEALCAQPDIDAIYIATPHQLHREHVAIAAAHGRHVLVEKPMAISLEECTSMIDAARRAGVHLVVGHSHSFDAPVLRARALIDSGEFGRVRMITALDFTDYMYRPRRPEEMDTGQGGGVLFSQAAHQVDIVRLLGGGRVRSVRAHASAWDAARPTEGAYSALLDFEEGAFASLTYSGYAHFDSDEFCGGIGESGERKDPTRYGAARRALAATGSADAEASLKAARNYGGESAVANAGALPQGRLHQHFGPIIVSCEHADLRPLPTGVMVYADDRQWLEALPAPVVPRSEVIDELCAAVCDGVPPLHDGTWSRSTLEVCLAMLRSARDGCEVRLEHQQAPRR